MRLGIGEVTSQSYVCKAIIEAPRSAERRHGLREILVGQKIDDLDAIWQRMYYNTNRFGRRGAAIHAISGVDIALWDLMGKALDKPVCDLLGGAETNSIRAYASLLFGEVFNHVNPWSDRSPNRKRTRRAVCCRIVNCT